MISGVEWEHWSVVLLKPDCLRRNLVAPIIAWLAQELQIIAKRTVTVTEEQILAHYADMLSRSEELGVDVPSELRRIFVGHEVTVLLVVGEPGTPERLRAMLGPTIDPGPNTIRGHYGIDTLPAARAEGRLLDNLIHSSDTAPDVSRDLALWFGPRTAELLAEVEPAILGGTP